MTVSLKRETVSESDRLASNLTRPEELTRDVIVRKIVKFADAVMAKERQKPPARQHDVAEFQIVVEFHQTNRRLAAAITRAFKELPQDPGWKNLPEKHQIDPTHLRYFFFFARPGGSFTCLNVAWIV